MAEKLVRHSLGHAHASNHLNYGHLATTSYNEEHQEWSFMRCVSTTDNDPAQSAFPFQILENDSRLFFYGQEKEFREQSQRRQGRSNVKALLKHAPTAIPAIGYIKEHRLDVPPDSASATEQEPNISDRLAFGHASQICENGTVESTQYVPIVAFAAGVTAEMVKLICLDSKSLPDANDTHFSGRNLSTTNQNEALWVGSGQAVHQIRFASSVGAASAWMAIRQQSLITILHPVFHYRSIFSRHSLENSTNPQRVTRYLDVNPVVSLPSSRTGGYPFADIVFDPSNHRLFALIDEHGNWSVWKMHGAPFKGTARLVHIDLQHQGKFSPLPSKADLKGGNPYYDGWHRIWWLGHVGTEKNNVLVVNRRHCAIIGTDADGVVSMNLRLGQRHERQWVLDAVRGNTDTSLVFILTSTRLLIFLVPRTPGLGHTEASTDLLCSWSHFRSRNDLSMRLSLIETEQSIIVVVYSQQSTFATVYRIALEPTSKMTVRSLADPVLVELSRGTYGSSSSERASLCFSFVNPQSRPRDSKLEAGSLLKLFVQYDSLQILERVYRCTDPALRGTSVAVPLSHVWAPSSTSSRHGVSERERESNPKTVNADSITSDDEKHQPPHNFGPPVSKARKCKSDLQVLYNAMVSSAPSLKLDLGGWLENPDGNELRTALGERRIMLLTEVLPSVINVSDVGRTASALRTFINLSSRSDTTIFIRQIQLLTQHSPMELYELYNSMLSVFLTRLSPVIPDRTRVTRERLIRNIAAEIALSSVILHKASAESREEAEQASPEPSIENGISGAITRLQTYTNVVHDSVTSSAHHPSLQSMLFHLPTNISTHPSSYSYQGTEQALAHSRAEAQIARLDTKARKRLERRTQAQQRILQAQEQRNQQIAREMGTVPMVLDSQRSLRTGAPMVALPFREVQSSQPPALGSSQSVQLTEPFPMSQPEPGVFGARNLQANTKVKKSRPAGFK